MMPTEHTLEGVYEHKMDPKCRVSVPSDWRGVAGTGVLRLMRSSAYDLPTLRVLTEREFASIFERIESRADWTPGQKSKMAGKVYSDCQQVSVNPQGKLLIPKALCACPGIEPEGQVVLVGRGAYFEIISPDNFEEMRVREEAEIAELNAEMNIF